MNERPVKAALLPPGPRLIERLAAALEGTGPALCPLPPGAGGAPLESRLAALRPTEVETAAGTRARDSGMPVAGSTAVLVATSGSLGHPKIAELSAAALRASALATLRRIGARAGERWLCCLPPSHIAGLQVLVRSLVAGTEPVIHERFEPAAVGAALAGGQVDHMALVPTQLRRLLEAGMDLTPAKTILLGGAAAPPDLLAAARAAGGRVVTTYGMSETCGGCVYDGVPLDGVEVALAPDGRIAVAGPVLFEGYRLRPDLTAQATRLAPATAGIAPTAEPAMLHIGAAAEPPASEPAKRETGGTAGGAGRRWFVSPDLGRWTGGRLSVLGRVDDVINTGGEKVIAGEVAAALGRHPAVAEVVVVGRPDPQWGERVTAVIVPAEGVPAPSLDELRGWVRRSLPACAAPREIRLVPALPLLPSGKPDRRALLEGG
jgi:O-succinylbenzoic acid--CoA ligase